MSERVSENKSGVIVVIVVLSFVSNGPPWGVYNFHDILRWRKL